MKHFIVVTGMDFMSLLRNIISSLFVAGLVFSSFTSAFADVLVDQITDRSLWEGRPVVGQVSNSAGSGYDGGSAIQVTGNGERLATLSGLFGSYDTLGNPNAGNFANFVFRVMVWDSVNSYIADPYHRNPDTTGIKVDMMPSNSDYMSVYGHAQNQTGVIDLHRTDFDVRSLNYTLSAGQTYIIAVVPRADFFTGMGVMAMSSCSGSAGLGPFWYSSETPFVAPNTYAALGAALPGVTYRIETLAWCRSDADHNGVLSVQDIFTFLQQWFGGALVADTDRNGVLSVQDIFSFLQLWFGGVC